MDETYDRFDAPEPEAQGKMCAHHPERPAHAWSFDEEGWLCRQCKDHEAYSDFLSMPD